MGVKAIVQTGVRAIEMREFERPAIHDDDALLRIEQSGVCGSDWSQFKMGTPANVIPGHEPIGTIEEIGPLAAARWGVEVGARVAIETMLPCGFCRHCIDDRERGACRHLVAGVDENRVNAPGNDGRHVHRGLIRFQCHDRVLDLQHVARGYVHLDDFNVFEITEIGHNESLLATRSGLVTDRRDHHGRFTCRWRRDGRHDHDRVRYLDRHLADHIA